jgi:hypothetical protein
MRNARSRISLAVLVMLSLLPLQRALALNPETLLMPGKLSSAHQKYEEDCSQCHNRANRAQQRELCLACHKPIAADIAGKRGFHGHAPGMATAQCAACHSEHLGRDADIVRLSRAAFDHQLTDFPLQGAHAGLACDSCHTAGKPYRAAPSTCVACHAKVEPHDGKLGRDCAACHNVKNWHDTRFNHDKTAFALRGAHAEVPCAQCHFGNRYKGTPTQCAACHAPDDVHRGSRGDKCADCHTVESWKSATFDHAKQTGFALLGVHARLACNDCHRSGNLKDPLPKDCKGCHVGQDAHAGRFGNDCAKCHGNDAWKPASFDHERDAKWALTGLHARVDCHACHTASVATQKLGQDCAGCHRADDVHAGSLGTDCAQCHTTMGWRTDVRFDHDFTDFPLVGQHVVVPCEQCHVTRAYKTVAHDCYSCHAKQDVHHDSLGHDCAKCHSANGWNIWEFDHGKQTGFALTGAHRKLTCAQCHREAPEKVKLSTSCAACHRQDDVHLGQFGQRCERCHTTATFKGARRQ